MLEERLKKSKRLIVVKNTYDKISGYYLAEELYCTEEGKFFIFGVGGEFTRYGVGLDENEVDEFGNGKCIIDISKEEAREWASEYLTPDEFSNFENLIHGEEVIEIIDDLKKRLEEKFKVKL